MSSSINLVVLLGNLTKDPILRYTQGGSAVCNCSIATNRVWKDGQGNQQQDTQFTDLVAWGKVGEIMNQYLRKGSKCVIQGRLQTSSYTDKEGIKRQKTEVIVNELTMLGKPVGEEQQTGVEVTNDVIVDNEVEEELDLTEVDRITEEIDKMDDEQGKKKNS